LIRSSTACRALETAELVISYLPQEIPLEVFGGLYHAPPETLKLAASQVAPSITRVMIVAHNPGMYELLNQFTEKIHPSRQPQLPVWNRNVLRGIKFFGSKPKLKF
jgi:phosphohistidine phosphatase SixA